jgi:hypothetical protein
MATLPPTRTSLLLKSALGGVASAPAHAAISWTTWPAELGVPRAGEKVPSYAFLDRTALERRYRPHSCARAPELQRADLRSICTIVFGQCEKCKIGTISCARALKRWHRTGSDRLRRHARWWMDADVSPSPAICLGRHGFSRQTAGWVADPRNDGQTALERRAAPPAALLAHSSAGRQLVIRRLVGGAGTPPPLSGIGPSW